MNPFYVLGIVIFGIVMQCIGYYMGDARKKKSNGL